MAFLFYAVRKGRKPGVYTDWSSCRVQVQGFEGAVYKGFNDFMSAVDFVQGRPTGTVQNDRAKNEASGPAASNGHSASGKKKDESASSAARTADRSANRTSTKTPARSVTRTATRTGKGVNGQKEAAFTPPKPYAFVDGSYNIRTKRYGYGGFLVHDSVKEELTGSGTDPELASMRNVAGEILGAEAAVRRAQQLGIRHLTICYDYLGIEMWATGRWKRNKRATQAYHSFMTEAMKTMELTFIKMQAHTGIEGNEEADRLAKKAAGLL